MYGAKKYKRQTKFFPNEEFGITFLIHLLISKETAALSL